MKSLPKRRTMLLNGALGVALLGTGTVGYLSLGGGGGAATSGSRTTTVARGTLESSVSASGSVASAKTQSLTFATSGTLTNTYAKPGDKVRHAPPLAPIRTTTA